MNDLLSNRVSLRAIESNDSEVLFDIENDTSGWIQSDNFLPFSKDMLSRYTSGKHDLVRFGQYRFMIEKTSEIKPIGCVDLFDYNAVHSRAGVGIYISESHRNKSYGREALELLISYSKERLNLRMLHCSILDNNETSKRLFNSVGFSETGVRNNWYLSKGDYRNIILLQKEL
ncbi:MAG: GNAT family protein [Flavobacteriales bacterium]